MEGEYTGRNFRDLLTYPLEIGDFWRIEWYNGTVLVRT